MRLKKTFAGILAAAMMVCAVSVPAFAAQDVEAVEEENCISSTYVVMNAYYASMIGKTVTQITYYTADGVYVLPVNVVIPAQAN